MHTTLSQRMLHISVAFLLTSSVVLSSAAHAQTAALGTVTIEQSNQFNTFHRWTIVGPHDVTYTGISASDQVQLAPGMYTFFIQQPKGLASDVTLLEGTALLQHHEVPQFSFTYDGVAPLTIRVVFVVKESGKIGVSSNPKGIPYLLQGPSGFILQGVTPASYEALPLGQYSVRYQPKGCNEPPAKSGNLIREGRIDFMITIQCDSLLPTLTEELKNQDFVNVLVDGEQVAFLDVPKSQWYAPYVEAVARRGIITGYKSSNGKPLGMFGPTNNVTLAELAKIAHEIGGLNEKEAYQVAKNTSTPPWAERYIASAEMRDWLLFTDTSVNVRRFATRAEVLVTLLQALNVPLEWPTGLVFSDVSRRTPYANAIETAAAQSIVSGKVAGNVVGRSTFGPTDAVNRAELSKILTKMMDVYEPQSGSGALR